MSFDKVHASILKNCDTLTKWMRAQTEDLYFPIYSSFDIRDSGFKVAPVDANIYPAGFNNICEVDRAEAPQAFRRFLDNFSRIPGHANKKAEKIALLTEEHTSNAHYWDNVFVLCDLLSQAGRDVRVCIPRPMESPVDVPTAMGRTVRVYSAMREGDHIIIDKNFVPDLIISNNDFSDSYDWWAKGLATTVVPARELGWYQRKKSNHFLHYNRLATEFAKTIDMDPWIFTVDTEIVTGIDFAYEEDRSVVAGKVDAMLNRMREQFKKHGINQEPTVFIKNNSGTYGLGVTQATSGADVRSWNAKNRKKMQAAKGGRDVAEIIIQEGIPSVVTSEGITAEPVIYMVGCELAGGFLRAHSEKGPTESLNSPGAVYKKLCMSDLQIRQSDCPLENVYGWSARLALLAIGNEAKELNLKGPGGPSPCWVD